MHLHNKRCVRPTCFKGLNMEIHQVFTFFNNFNPLVSKIFTNLVNSNNFLGLCAKNEYKDCNMNSMQNTKGNLDKTTTIGLVLCAMQCTPIRKGVVQDFS